MGTQGASHLFYAFMACPSYRASWERALGNADRCLEGNEVFAIAFRWFMKCTDQDPDATVSGYVFNPLNIVFGLWQWVVQNDARALPKMELFRDGGPGKLSSMLDGFVAWDGVTYPQDPESLLRDCAKDEFGVDYAEAYFMAAGLNDAWAMEPAVMRRHGLVYCLIENTLLDGKISQSRRMMTSEEGVSAVAPEVRGWRPLAEFVRENSDYVRSLVELLDAHFRTYK